MLQPYNKAISFDKQGKKIVSKLLEDTNLFIVKDLSSKKENQYGIDLEVIYKKDNSKIYIDPEIRLGVWKNNNSFKYETLSIPYRKKKFINANSYFASCNPNEENFILTKSTLCEEEFLINKSAKIEEENLDDRFYHIPIEKTLEIKCYNLLLHPTLKVKNYYINEMLEYMDLKW